MFVVPVCTRTARRRRGAGDQRRIDLDRPPPYAHNMRMKARDVIAALEADGWREVRTKGSHRQFKHPTKPGLVTLAVHGGRDVPRRDLASIERQSGVSLRKE